MKNERKLSPVEKQKRDYKDSLFVDLFAKCPESKENFLSLYNALHGTSLPLAETKIEPLILEQTVYTGRYNDVSMLVDEKVIVLAEQQSTVNENMPFRFLEYVSRLYEKLIPLERRYEHHLIRLPEPEFYVFYNGRQNYPAEKVLRLSDAFWPGKKQDFSLELCAKVYNINKRNEASVVQRCAVLSGYAKLTEYAREAKAQGRADFLDYAVQRCIKEGTLSGYLKRNSTEVRNMLIGEYDYDTDIRVQRRESAEETRIETAQKMLDLNLGTPEQIASVTSLPLEQVLELQKEAKLVKA